MKLAIVLIVFYVRFINAGLTPEERDKLMTAINKDRAEVQKKFDYKLPPLEYNITMEKEIDKVKTCNFTFIFFRSNEILAEVTSKRKSTPYYESARFFFFGTYQIGCSKTFKCSEKGYSGKVMKGYGACAFSLDKNSNALGEIIDSGLPPLSKYADIIGVTASSAELSGKVFSLIFALLLVFYV